MPITLPLSANKKIGIKNMAKNFIFIPYYLHKFSQGIPSLSLSRLEHPHWFSKKYASAQLFISLQYPQLPHSIFLPSMIFEGFSSTISLTAINITKSVIASPNTLIIFLIGSCSLKFSNKLRKKTNPNKITIADIKIINTHDFRKSTNNTNINPHIISGRFFKKLATLSPVIYFIIKQINITTSTKITTQSIAMGIV
jgi:hypothetical protein